MFRSWNNLRVKFVIGFLVVLTPLLVFVFYNNLYAMEVVRDQVSKAYIDQLEKRVNQHNLVMKMTNSYIYSVPDRDPDITALYFTAPGSNEYALIRQRIINKFGIDMDFYTIIDSLFLYTAAGDEFIFMSKSSYNERLDLLGRLLPDILQAEESEVQPEWRIVDSATDKAMMKVVTINPDLYMGAWIKFNDLLEPIKAIGDEHLAGSVIVDKQGFPLSGTTLSPGQLETVRAHQGGSGQPYQTVRDPDDGQKYLLISVKFELADVYYTLLIKEEALLQNLPFFQRAVFLIPAAAAVILLFALLFIRNILFTPMNVMMQGMRRVMKGDLEVRLRHKSSTEFDFLIRTFNDMVAQIQHLKIDVYEEQLRTKEAEYKHLQVQINPHFYLNSLNIIYSLSALNKQELVQEMAEHLAEYFRFAIRTNRSFVQLHEELAHIDHYMEIQKLRFPRKLTFSVSLPDDCRSSMIPPLTIQPFVENCVVHGFKDRKRVLAVEVRITPDERMQDTICIRIQDNGPGFPSSLLEMLRHEQEDADYGDKHLGIWNVRHRLKMKFGERASIQFGNREGDQGAVVTIRLPKQIYEEETGGHHHVQAADRR
ncbi:two-component system, sensor histidine kinase YesM [Paenibacillus sp. UNCCL117]|uniref:sensor histidine kinase n=1 Tax=unclassified Paenibacillus TaxID=185978 RepID=UPI000887084B|nr:MULTISPECIES: sensor histidine kinase [unclassified Paenibacillus]SDD40498.1 two-component system, sensor histidine kinase YesM [Paenibacillus sp. cl123]SFW48085.1 two-component system, sensor histidine kinase YesM [Paenibacillus sp. UNCCL117]